MGKRLPLISDVPTIVFGADVTHPHPGEESSSSIAAVVASKDWPFVSKYACLVRAQEHRQEIIQDLFNPADGGMVVDLLRTFYINTGVKPMRIIFYRDGVSEGQFHQEGSAEVRCAMCWSQVGVVAGALDRKKETRVFEN